MPHQSGVNALFPVKHNWFDDRADMELIRQSARSLKKLAEYDPVTTFILPRPGCGNGRLPWPTVLAALLEESLPDNVWIITPKEAAWA